jgi:hypothetical protein
MSYIVTLTSDPVVLTPGTLRYGIVNAIAGESITFDSSFNTPQTIILQQGQLAINVNLNII